MRVDTNDEVRARVEAVRRRLPEGAVFSGLTAASLHGLNVLSSDRVEFTIPKSAGVTTRSGMVVRRAVLNGDEVVTRRGLCVTSVIRTLLDVSCRQPLTEAVVVADQALYARLITADQLVAALDVYSGAWGIKALRQVAWHAEPLSESPMETRMRMPIVLAGLPRPQAQVPIHDRAGQIIGRPDLYYPEQRLGLEYDGGTHRLSLAEDNRRQNRLLDVGVRLLRFTARDIYDEPEAMVALVRAQLAGSVHTTIWKTA